MLTNIRSCKELAAPHLLRAATLFAAAPALGSSAATGELPVVALGGGMHDWHTDVQLRGDTYSSLVSGTALRRKAAGAVRRSHGHGYLPAWPRSRNHQVADRRDTVDHCNTDVRGRGH